MSTESNIGHAILGLAIGAVGVACGGMSFPTAGVGALVGAAISNVGAGVIANISHEGLKDGYQAVAARLQASAHGRLPANHDLTRAIRKSHLNALQFLLNGIRTAASQDRSTYDIAVTETFCNAADIWVRGQLKEADSRDFMLGVSLEHELVEFRALIEPNENTSAVETLSELGMKAANSAFAEFSEELKNKYKVAVPESFRDWFDGQAPESVGWVTAAHAFFAERLKTDSRLCKAVFLDLLNQSLRGIDGVSFRLDAVLTAMTNQGDVLSNRFDRLDAAIRTLMERKVKIDEGSLSDALFSALTRSDFPRALASRIGVEAPADSWAAIRAAVDVRDRIAALSTTVFGREAEVAALDAFIECHERGLAVVAAPAGGGKSAFLAHWLDRRRAGGDVVVRHFVSGLFTGTIEPVDTLRHLSAQLREVDAIRSDDPTERIPYEPAELLDKLTARLSSPPPENERLIVVLDGLDELKTPLSDVFVRATLARGVFVIVSGRAAPDEAPSYLKQWETIQLSDVPFHRFDIPGLSVSDVLIWLEDIIGHLDGEEMALLAGSVRKTTDGLPLFLHYVIEDMTNWLPQVRSREERLARVAAMPSRFSDYVAQELVHLRDEMGTSLTASVRTLFALLTRTCGPIADNEIEAVFSFCQIADAGFPSCPVLTGIDHRVGRWLSIRDTAGGRLFSFAHPRLAIAFSNALGDQAEHTEDYLITWMESAWQSRETRRGIRPGADYALDWLPEHLSSVNKHQAAHLLSSPTFLQERLRDPRHASRRLGATLDQWGLLRQEVKDAVPGSPRWTAFWAENETRLREATMVSAAAGLDTAKPTLQCLGDANVSGTDALPPRPAAMISYRPSEQGLLRSIDDAHSGGSFAECRGVLPVGDRLVSWGRDGAIRFWSLEGAPLAGGATDAHCKEPMIAGCRGVLPVGDRLVSWGNDGAIRFWSLEGAPLAGGADHAHSDDRVEGVEGVLPVGDRLVSWGQDGAIRFWSLKGAPLAGGADHAHSAGICLGAGPGVLPVGDRLVSWGEDGAIRFWSLEGAPLAGGATDAHRNELIGGCRGVLPVGDRLISWGRDGAIRFWSLEGAPLAGEVDHAHSDGVLGVLPLGDRLVSWGSDGAIRFWPLEGAHLGGADAHCNELIRGCRGALTVGDRLVSWDKDGAIRFWSLEGVPLAGGSDHAHPGGMFGACLGVLPVGDRLVSWGRDGAIRFWSVEGALLVGGSDHAHSEGICLRAGPGVLPVGVLPVGDRLVSWDQDGAIRFWSLEGAPLAGGAADAHSGAVVGVLPVGDRLVSWAVDGAIRFWSLEGVPLAGGVGHAHSHTIEGWGILPLDDRLVSWAADGAIRFWSLEGAPLAGGGDHAHRIGVKGILALDDRLVSWGEDGAIRFWSLEGAALTGGAADAHPDGVASILTLDDRLVSWGYNGAFRFWTLEGVPLGGGAATAHSGEIFEGCRGVLQVGDRLVSWGYEGAFRFWTLNGVLVDMLVVPGGFSAVHVASDRLIACGRALWSYKV